MLLLSANATSSYTRWDAFYCPLADRVVKVDFFVDDTAFLAEDFLEVTIIKNRYQKHVVDIRAGKGGTEMMVPDGPIDLVICGLVNCPLQETEMACGSMQIPAQIPVDKTHQVTFSTRCACREALSSLVAKSR